VNRRGILRQVLSSGAGKVGVAMALTLSIVAGWVLITYPLDFGPRRWSDPGAWADLPKAAPPAWTALLDGREAVEHLVLTADEPSAEEPRGAGVVRTYSLPVTRGDEPPPTFLSFSLGRSTFADRPPALQVVLVRPDGEEVVLLRTTVRGARPGEEGPHVRHGDVPLRVNLSTETETAEAASAMLEERYGVSIAPAALRNRLEAALFGAPDESGAIVPLPGDYRVDVRVALADPADAIDDVRVVLGGSVYGLMGTDAGGRDLAEGLLFGLPIALLIGLLTATVSTTLGTGLGLVSGYMGGRVDLLIQRAADVVNNVPLLPLLIFFVFVLGAQLWLILLLLVAFSWPGLAILVRSMVLGLGGSQEVEAARALGASHRHIIVRHIFPHTAPYVFMQLIFAVPAVILAEAGLSFLGLGDPTLPTWGQVLEDGFRTGAVFLGYWWWVISPGVLIVVTAVTFMLLALAMEPVVNPRLRRD
jgi:peptide/nickel transport system permease protein